MENIDKRKKGDFVVVVVFVVIAFDFALLSKRGWVGGSVVVERATH